MKRDRAYSIIEIKSLDEDQRIIEGIASTPSTDRVGDIVEPLGAKFKLPLPLLWQHRSGEPVGHVTFAKATEDGIPFKAKIAKIEEAGELKNLTDKAWQSVKSDPPLVRGVSIGFVPHEVEPIKDSKQWGLRIKEWEWLELSLVTIPANADATITMVRTIDQEFLARKGHGDVKATRKPIKLKETSNMPKTIRERINEAEASLAAKAQQMQAIMDAADEKGETLDAEAEDKFATLKSEHEGVEKHLVRLRDMERINVTRAAPVNGGDPDAAAKSRNSSALTPIVSVRQREVEPWRAFIRLTKARVLSRLDSIPAYEIAERNERWMAETPEVAQVLKAPVAVGTTSDSAWAGPLVNYQILSSQFIEYLRALTIIGRIPGLTRVPFKVRVPRQTTASTVNWVGEGAPKPLSSLAFDSITLDFAKIAGIVVITEELARSSEPAAEDLIRRDLTASIVAFMDSQFVDPSKAATGISPASITNGVTALTPSGTTGTALMQDLNRLFGQFLTNNLSLESAALITTQQVAMRIGSLLNSFGQPMFPTANAQGGSVLGVPIVVSENIPSTTGSPTEGWPIILVSAREILLADDGQVTVDASREASLQMETAPDSPPTASTLYQSLWQTNSIGIRAERFINWTKRRSTAVSYISNAVYTG